MKLIRDKLPEIMLNRGMRIDIRTANGREYEFMLMKKLQEEVDEYMRERNAVELADIEETLRCIAELKGISWESVEEIRKKKLDERGSFRRRIILEKVFENETSK